MPAVYMLLLASFAIPSMAPYNDVVENMEAVLATTRNLFLGHVTIEERCDPEYPDVTYLVFRVESARKPGDIDALIDLELLWHRRIAEFAPELQGKVRLLIE